jgi:hypothetical protein
MKSYCCKCRKKIKIDGVWREVTPEYFDIEEAKNFPVSHGYCKACALEEISKLEEEGGNEGFSGKQ